MDKLYPLQRLRPFDDERQRLFFDEGERASSVAAAKKAARPAPVRRAHRTCRRLMEAMGLAPGTIDLMRVAYVSFQRQEPGRRATNRDVPAPASLIDLLDRTHDVRDAQSGLRADERIGPQGRSIGW